MAKRKLPKHYCFIDGCPRVAVQGAKICRDHFDPRALQVEIERLRSSTPEGIWELLRYSEVRALLGALSSLDRGTGSKSANGKLGAAVSRVARAAEEVKRIADPGSGPPRRTHCQRPVLDGASFCGECGDRLRPQRRMRASGSP